MLLYLTRGVKAKHTKSQFPSSFLSKPNADKNSYQVCMLNYQKDFLRYEDLKWSMSSLN